MCIEFRAREAWHELMSGRGSPLGPAEATRQLCHAVNTDDNMQQHHERVRRELQWVCDTALQGIRYVLTISRLTEHLWHHHMLLSQMYARHRRLTAGAETMHSQLRMLKTSYHNLGRKRSTPRPPSCFLSSWLSSAICHAW